jgi:glycosyltransferase involved in cell wall biosynthesis
MAEQRLPLVNVVIANHNYGKWLERAIKSAISQDYPNKVVTVVDDCSDDNSVAVIEKLAKQKFENNVIKAEIDGVVFIAIRLENISGPSHARNVAIEASKNDIDIYAILDADDEFLSGKLTRCVSEMMQQNMIGAVYADYITEDVDTNIRRIEYKEPFSRNRLMQECIVHSGALILKQALLDVLDEFGYYDFNMRTCEDYDLWMRISEKYMICHIAEPLTVVRVHKNNSTNTVDNSIWQQNWQRIAQKTQYRNNKG